jgi:uncharacterized alkaline shock family protein YloU
MSRRIQGLLTAICLLLLFCIAVLTLAVRLPADGRLTGAIVNAGIYLLDHINDTIVLVALVLPLLLVPLILLLAILRMRDEVFITRQTEQGSVTIIESAIRRYVRQVASNIDSVQSVKARLTNAAEGLVVDLHTHVLVTDSLPRIEERIRLQVRQALEETLGVGGVAAINVIIEGFEKAPMPGQSKAAAPAVAEPVGDDSFDLAGAMEEREERWAKLFPRSRPESETENETESESQPPEVESAEIDVEREPSAEAAEPQEREREP